MKEGNKGKIEFENVSKGEVGWEKNFKLYADELKEYSRDNLVIFDIESGMFKVFGNIVSTLSDKGKNHTKVSYDKCLEHMYREDIEKIQEYWNKGIDKKEKIILEFRMLNIFDDIIWVELKLKPSINADGALDSYRGYIHDITREKNLEEELRNVIDYDIVTRLPNKYYIKEIIDNYLMDSEKENLRGTLLLINIDNFKIINEYFGHEDGDLLLKHIADSLINVIGDNDLICRYGGDEFIVFKPEIECIEDSEQLVISIKDIFEEPFTINDNELYITVSIGVALSPENGQNFSTLLKSSDSAMHRAKSNGKDVWEYFDKSISTEVSRTYVIQKGLRTAIQYDEFYVVFQPKVALTDSKVNGFEALIRWNSKELGLVSPAEFIPIAENTRLILPIGRFVLEEVFKKVKALLEEGYDNFKIAVNFSEVQLRYGTIVKDFSELIEKYGVSPKYIEVEITESMLMKTFDDNIHRLQLIKDLGVSVALDDFGTGYSSLNYLTKLPIDVLKIDRSFVIDLVNNDKSRCIVENIIQLSHELGIDVVAEGVEYIEQVDYLKEILCDVVQGYYFSKPEVFEKIKNLLGKTL
ncbi:putative bifunctional diguanylate cyclase/phosphodiesterase [Clostridium paraputrificum]|uniref:putative bifunctional diguanylate cyclase/phosphodiesterase n=1 Tax=Clostridium paraputrificum TaxID=29363 RepID=UPI003D34BB30